MTYRRALIVANDSYRDQRLSTLLAPRHDAEVLRELLRDPEIGGFEPADILVNESKTEIERALERLFRDAGPGDLVTLYFSGHGVRSRGGRLHLAVSNTELDLLAATAVSASFVKELIDESDAASTVVLLDCCYSGAFADGLKSEPAVDLGRELQAGRGIYVLSASNAVENAEDGAAPGADGARPLSAFTGAIVRGLATGEADVRGVGRITPSDLWEYVRQEVPRQTTRQTPTQYGYVEDEVHLAKVGRGQPTAFGQAGQRVHLGDLIGRTHQTADQGLRAEELNVGPLVVPIGRMFRGTEPADRVWLDLARGDGHLLVVGRVGSGKSTLLRTLMGALSLAHTPAEVRFYALESGGNRLGSLRRLPAFARLAGDDDPDAVRDLLAEVAGVIRRRKRLFRAHDIDSADRLRFVRHSLPEGPHPDIFLLVDRWSDFAQEKERVLALAGGGLEYGVHVILTARSWREVPADLQELMHGRVEFSLGGADESRIDPRLSQQLPDDRPGWALQRRRRFLVALPDLRLTADTPPEALAVDSSDGALDLVERVNRAWLRTGAAASTAAAQVRRPLSVSPSVLDLLGVEEPTIDGVLRVRAGRVAWERLRVPIGVDADDQPVWLDIKEQARDGAGPHGLLVGATGSGKSELLRTIVTALALTHGPEALNFVLVDYKGAATFASLDRLPHTAALISNLADDLALVDRMMDAINGELLRRQELLRGAGNYPSAWDYEKARAAGASLKPLPSLMIICDEFSDLLVAKPDVIDLFVGIGRVGRSLGVHLLLASQRLEEGRLRGLDTYLTYRVGLRTFSALESRAVLGVPDAYELPRSPGHAYLRVGADPPTRFLAAMSSQVLPGDQAGTESVPVVEWAARLLGAAEPPAEQVWLPPLSRPPALDELLGPVVTDPVRGLTTTALGLRGALRVPVAIVDRPAERRRDALVLDLAGAGGNVAVVGMAQSGKSAAIRTLVAGLVLTHTPAEVQIYCLDFGGGSLAPLRDLPHVGGVAERPDAAAVRRTVSEVAALLTERERRFGELGVDSMGSYRRRRAHGAGQSGGAAGGVDDDPFGDVFLVVDGWATVRSEFDDLEPAIADIVAHGLTYGIHVVAAAARWMDFRPATRDQFGSRLELRLGDPSDSMVNRRSAATVPERAPGRGITADGLHFLTAAPELSGVAGETAALVKAVAANWTGPPAPAVRLLPKVLAYDELDAGTGRGLSLPIGIAEADLRPVAVDFATEPHFLLFGDAESGKSSFLRALATTITKRFTPDQARIILVDYRRSLLGAVDTDHLIAYGTSAKTTAGLMEELAATLQRRLPGPDVSPQQLRDRSWWTGPECFVLVDDYDLVAAGTTNPIEPLREYLAQGRDVGLHLVLTRRSGGAGRALYEPVIQLLREMSSPGMVLSGSRDEGALLGSVRPSPMPPGRGWLVTRRTGAQLIQLAYLPAQD